ncbi:c-type cytochrome [Castellaniella denitrificans]|jgi:cytochrome c553|uniref:c-type cytochrome n=1 Tax=Castellaniella denitrificans TaxID=56119 RepID=UPI001ACE3B9A|nr:cytochrome c4 [Burkholderiales bacterium]
MKRALSSVFMAGSLILAGALPGLAHAADAPKPDAKAGEQLFLNGDMSRGVLACVTCHGEGGNSTIPMYPSLAAMPHEYIAKQLHDFKSVGDKPPVRNGAEGAPSVMAPMAGPLTEADIQNVALYLSHQKVDWDKAATATHENTTERGQAIWRAGIADRKVPACAACHSANGAGLPGEFPRLAGQHPSYLLDQLKLFRSGDRANDIMRDIADRMTDQDLAAVADYAAGLR